MTTGFWLLHDDSPFEFPSRQWTHSSFLISPITSKHSVRNPWVSVKTQQDNASSCHCPTPQHAPSRLAQKRKRLTSDHGSFGSGCGVKNVGGTPPRHHEYRALPSSSVMEEQSDAKRDLRWLREHIILTSKHLPSRAPLPDKGKPVVRRGRKATGQISDLTAGLPEEE